MEEGGEWGIELGREERGRDEGESVEEEWEGGRSDEKRRWGGRGGEELGEEGEGGDEKVLLDVEREEIETAGVSGCDRELSATGCDGNSGRGRDGRRGRGGGGGDVWRCGWE